MTDIYRPRPDIERAIALQRGFVDIPQAQVVKGLAIDTTITAAINPGACVLAISREQGDKYTAGHFQAGEIVRELTALARLSPDGVVAVYHRPAEGNINLLYESGLHLNPQQAKRVFKKFDRQDITCLS